MFLRTRAVLRYAWASPATVVGLTVAAVACLLGARARQVAGVLEVAGGRLADLLARSPRTGRFVAITLGHVVLGRNEAVLDRHRVHEHEHVRQYERWGILFFPLYLGESLVLLMRGRDPYLDNRFERQAREASRLASLQEGRGSRTDLFQ